MVFERAVPAHYDENGDIIPTTLYAPPVSEMIDETVDLSGIKIYSRRGSESTCWLRNSWGEYNDDRPHHEWDFDFCGAEGPYPAWVPIFLVGDNGEDFSPAVVEGGTWPNNLPILGEIRDAWSMAIDCSGLNIVYEGFDDFREESLAQTKVLLFPIGSQDGPCWNDPELDGQQVCAAGGIRGSHENDLYRDIDGNFYPFCPDDYDGLCPRYFAFNCPVASAKSVDEQKLEF